MYDFLAQRSNYPFKGVIFNEYRYFQENKTITIDGQTFTYKKGDKNPWFKIGGEEFMFNITSLNVVDKKQPIGNLVVKSEIMSIDTKFKHKNFVQGGYIEFNGKLWIIKSVEEEKGPQKTIYGYFTYNPLSTIKMLVEEVQE